MKIERCERNLQMQDFYYLFCSEFKLEFFQGYFLRGGLLA